MHDVFSDWERRAILYHLRHSEGHATVTALATHLVGWARGGASPADTDETAVERVRERIERDHLQPLDEFGVVVYDPRSARVRLADGMQVSVSRPWSDDADASADPSESRR